MAGDLVYLHQGIRPIWSAGGTGSQFPKCFLHGGDPGLTRVHPHGRQAIIPVPCSLLLCQYQQRGHVVADFLSLPPGPKAIQEGQFHLGMTGKLKLMQQRENVDVPPYIRATSFLHQSTFCRKKAYSAIV